MTVIRAGSLDRTIAIETPATGSVTLSGALNWLWSTLATLRARVVEQEVIEEVQPAGKGAITIERITFETRYVDGVTPACRVQYQGKIYIVKGVAEIQRRRGLELRVERIGA